MNHIVLVEPEIPQNTGNIARTCVATNTALHLVHPLGFVLDDKRAKRCGMDYWDDVQIFQYPNLDAFWALHGDKNLWLFTTKAKQAHSEVDYTEACNPEKLKADGEQAEAASEAWLLFGKESAGLPQHILKARPDRMVRIPMWQETRSLNLSNSVAIGIYEVLRQQGYKCFFSHNKEQA